MEKLSLNKVVFDFENEGFKILNINDYKDKRTKLICFDKDGYKYNVNYIQLKNGKKFSKWAKTNPFSIYNIQNFLNINNSNSKVLSNNFEGYKTLLKIECGKCHKIFERKWSDLKEKKSFFCLDCSIKIRANKRKLDENFVINEFKKNGIILLDKYENNSKRMLCINKDGYKGYVTYNHYIKRGQKDIELFSTKHNKQNVIYNLNNWCKLNNINSTIIGFYKNKENQYSKNYEVIKCKCSCGNTFITSITSFRYGKTKCDKCSKSISKYEDIFKNFLMDNKINFIYQYRIKNCKNKITLPFDFYLIDYNILIEIDGEGHYYPCYFNNCSKENAILSFGKIKKAMKIKDEYCNKNNIKLIRIPYWDFNNDNYKNKLNFLI